MTGAPPDPNLSADACSVSVVIVSRQRPDMLRRCLLAIGQLDYPNFEVVVVADPGGQVVASDFPVRIVPFDQPNISAARNLGLVAAAGEVVAFIDDDAVPEPQWLRHLVAPFANPDVAAAGGFVLGRNGISFQWQSGTVDRRLFPGPLPVDEHQPSLHRGQAGVAVEIKGVNCAYRRAGLMGLGGFDPALRYYLDETELNLRLAAIGGTTAIVPGARVHHAKAASALRRADRAPLSLWDVGASTAVTLRRHGAGDDDLAAARATLCRTEGDKLARHHAAGRLSATDIAALQKSLTDGFDEGRARPLPELAPLVPDEAAVFKRFPQTARREVILVGRSWSAVRLRAHARELSGRGAIVRLFLFSPTARYHRVEYSADGYWVQTGGLFGKSLRSDSLFRFWRFRSRVARETALGVRACG